MIHGIDWIITATYVVLFFTIVWFYAFFKYSNDLAKEFIGLFMIRVFGGILFALIFVYYYNVVGDTFQYWQGGMIMADLFYDDPSAYFGLMNSEAGEIPPEYIRHVQYIGYSNTDEEWFMTKFVSVFALIGFSSFLVYNVFFGVIAFMGAWQLMRFTREFLPEISRQAFYILSFVPGILIWSSGLIKDTLTLSCFSFFLLYFSKVVFKQERKISYYFIILISAYLMFRVKPYVLICEIPSLAFATYIFYKAKIKIPFLRRILMPTILAGLMSLSFFGVIKIAEASEKYRVENIEKKVKGFQSWHETLGGAYYTIGGGHIEYTMTGVLKVVPESLSHTYIRPFLWESRNASMLFTAVESFAILILLLISLRYYVMDP
ncbi:MAG: hypothetical protein JNJ99_07180, partial [Crocinitomicaceae bacterium]|nr:hypothetical protein [Crocinitomicaceae bacterium]